MAPAEAMPAMVTAIKVVSLPILSAKEQRVSERKQALGCTGDATSVPSSARLSLCLATVDNLGHVPLSRGVGQEGAHAHARTSEQARKNDEEGTLAFGKVGRGWCIETEAREQGFSEPSACAYLLVLRACTRLARGKYYVQARKVTMSTNFST